MNRVKVTMREDRTIEVRVPSLPKAELRAIATDFLGRDEESKKHLEKLLEQSGPITLILASEE